MLKKLDYENYKYQLESLLKRKDYKQAKKILLQALKYGYLDFSIQEIDLRKNKGRAKLIELINKFNDLKLVTCRTIKDRGWTDKIIEEFLWVDIYAKNPYYKTAPSMKLYCLSRVIWVENNQAKQKVQAILDRRERARIKKESQLGLIGLRWIAAIGNPYVAIALLLYLLDRANLTGLLPNRIDFNKLADRVIDKFIAEGYLVGACSSEKYDSHIEYYWFDFYGFKVWFSSHKFREIDKLNLPKNLILLQYNNNRIGRDINILLEISGWRSPSEALQGLSFLIEKDYMGKFELNTELIDKFTTPAHPNPITKDEIFIEELKIEQKEMKRDFDRIKQQLKEYEQVKCPQGFDCQKMGAINNYRCSNYESCKGSR